MPRNFLLFCIAEKRLEIMIKKKIIYFYTTKNVPIAKRMRKCVVRFSRECVVFVLIVVLKVDFPHALKNEKEGI